MSSVANGATTTTYLVNALGQRVRKSDGTTTMLFMYDEAGHLVGEYDGTGTLIEETLWMGDIPGATLRPNGGSGVDVFYVHTDHLNTPRRVSRPSDNAILWRWDSDPFGTTAANDDADGDTVPFVYNARFPGQYFDAESGLNYNYARDFDPVGGRYVESDPIGLRGGVNTYAYALNNPLSHSDPSGLLTRGQGLSDQEWGEVQKAESAIQRELGKSCSCVRQGPESCIPCDLVPELLNALDTTSVHRRSLPGLCGQATIFGRYIIITPDGLNPAVCQCVAITIYHELLHNVGLGHGRNDPVSGLDAKCRSNLCKQGGTP